MGSQKERQERLMLLAKMRSPKSSSIRRLYDSNMVLGLSDPHGLLERII
jgi:hypothetical protein